MRKTASTIIVIATPLDSLPTPNIPRMPPTSSRVHANAIREITVASPPLMMYGFLLPHLLRDLSLLMPTYGCTSTPESGPAIQTKARTVLLRPREIRYGYRCVSTCSRTSCKQCNYRTIRHLDRPSHLKSNSKVSDHAGHIIW